MIRLFKSKIYIAIALLSLIIVIGTFGYMNISGFSFTDALYMTVITVTTVGYGEVMPLTPTAKIFTIFLILFSVFTIGYVISVVSEYILSKNTFEYLKNKRMQKTIDKLEGHVIICGFGRNGKQAAEQLKMHNTPFIVIDKKESLAKKHEAESLFIVGNATDDDVLKQAGVERAISVIAAIPDDAENAFIVLSARQLNKKLNIISRATQEEAVNKIKLAGADHVILPDTIGGNHMASLVVAPDLIEFLEHLGVREENTSANIEEVASNIFLEHDSNATIKDLDIRNKTGCTVIGFKKQSGAYIVNPESEIKLEKDSKLIVLGRKNQIQELKNLCDSY